MSSRNTSGWTQPAIGPRDARHATSAVRAEDLLGPNAAPVSGCIDGDIYGRCGHWTESQWRPAPCLCGAEALPADHAIGDLDFTDGVPGPVGCRCHEPYEDRAGWLAWGDPVPEAGTPWKFDAGAAAGPPKPGEYASSNTGASGPLATTTRSFGVTTMQLRVNPDRFGTNDEQLDDVETLGAGIVRDPGGINLTWKALADVDVPLDREVLIEAISDDGNQGRLETFFRSLHSRGLRTVLQFPLADDRITLKVAEEKAAAGYPALDVTEPLALSWATDHHPADVGEWDFILDIRNTYHLTYVGYMAEGVARLLEAVEARLDGAFTVADVVFAIEIFPNVDDRNVQPAIPEQWAVGDATGNGERWGFAWAFTAEMLRRQLEARLVAVPAFFLPAISSHLETVLPSGQRSRNSLDYHLEFFDVLIRTIAGYDLSWSGGALLELATGVNYGWDHRADKDSEEGVKRVGPLHIGHLKREIALVHEVVAVAGLERLSIYVLDTGQSVSDDDEVVPTWMSDRETFQAYEVWRRVAGAVACGAAVSGWRSWMSSDTEAESTHGEEGYGMGLRDDEFGNSGTYAVAGAVPRLSWFAYQRLVETLGGVPAAHLVYPEVRGTDEPEIGNGITGLLIYRFSNLAAELFGSGTYVYLLLADATAFGSDGWCVAMDWANPASASDGTCSSRATLPSAISSAGAGLPIGTATWDPDTRVPVPATIGVQTGEAPLLLVTNHPLVFAVDFCPAVAIDVPPTGATPVFPTGIVFPFDPRDPFGVMEYVAGGGR